MLQRRQWQIILLVVITLTLISSNHLKVNAFPVNSNKQTNNESTLEIETKEKETEKYTFSIQIPITESKDINKTINKWIKEQKNDFLKKVEKNDHLLGGDYKAQLLIEVEANKVTENIYSLVFQSYQFTGGATGINLVKSFMIDLENNIVLQLDDVMEVNDESLDAIRSLVTDQLVNNEELYPYVFEDSLEEALQSPGNWDWSISKDAFTLYFDEYEIAAGAAGVIQVDIPIKEILPYLHKDFAHKLGLVE